MTDVLIGRLSIVKDVDMRPADAAVQQTPRCGQGALHLVVADIEQSRAELMARGVDVRDVQDAGVGVR